MTSRPGDPPVAPRDAIFEQLDKILSSAPFQTSERSSRLLRFLIEQSVSGRTDRLKEYEIGTEALGKGPTFDPRTDPIVRSEVSRLRTRLEKYYATSGQTDPLIIELPRGSYLPQIQSRSSQPAGTRERGFWGFRPFGWIAVGGVVAACVIALFMWTQTLRPGAPANVSIAVLPFANISGDPTQQFFSDGMTQDVITALARIPDLRVVARGSASQFKGEDKDMRAVGRALGASHLIEGSVRKDGTRVRITAQLVNAEDGVNVWVGSYDRDLTDVFAIQEEIATAIAGALRIPLGLDPGEQLIVNRAIDAASYEQFLRGKAEMLKGRSGFAQQIATLEPVVARNPNYAPAWAILAKAYRNAAQYHEIAASQSASPAELLRLRDTYLPKMDAAARRAIELDPNSAEALTTQATIEAGRKKWAVAEDLAVKALVVDPTNPYALDNWGNGLLMLGRVKEAVATQQKLRELEPFIPFYAGNLAQALWLDGQTDTAITILNENLGREGGGSARDLTQIYATLGRYQEAADVLSRFPGPNRDIVPTAAMLLRSAPAEVATESLPRLGSLGFIYPQVGAPERMLEYYEQARAPGVERADLWHPSYGALRKTERFKKIVRDAGLVDYWRERGWPAFCEPLNGDDFVCR
jgi:serine/threonine-protein kinase